MRVHQDFTANVLRGGKPHIVKNVKEEIERDLSLDEFRYWTAVVRLAPVAHVSCLYRVSVLDGATADLPETGVMSVPAAMLFSGARDTRGSQASWLSEYTNMDIVVRMHLALTLRDTPANGPWSSIVATLKISDGACGALVSSAYCAESHNNWP